MIQMYRYSCIAFVLAVIFLAGNTSDNHDALASGEHPCRINLQKKIFPATYDGYERANPDGTYYPGDAFYFLFVYSLGPQCHEHHLSMNQYHGVMIVEMGHTGKNPNLNSYRWGLDYTDFDNDLVIHEFIKFRNSPLFDSLDEDRRDAILARGNHSGNIFEKLESYCETLDEKDCVYGRAEILASSGAKVCDTFVYDNVSLDEKRIRTTYLTDKIFGPRGGYTVEPYAKQISSSASYLIDSQSSEQLALKDIRYISLNRPNDWSSNSYKHMYMRYLTIYNVTSPVVISSKAVGNYGTFVDTELHDGKEFCVNTPMKIDFRIDTSKTAHEIDKTGKLIHVTKFLHKTSAIIPEIIDPALDVLFDYPALLDLDALPAKNPDGTYYVDDPAAVVRYPNVMWAEQRWPLITFTEDSLNLSKPIDNNYSHDCDASNCLINATYSQIYHDNPLSYTNGYGVDVFATSDVDSTGLYIPTYNMTMYNLGDVVDTDGSSGSISIVNYSPVLSEMHSWSYLDDGGNTSFENRYALGIKYDGSLDEEDVLHPQRRAKLTDVAYAPEMTNGYVTVIPEAYNFTITNSDDIQNMPIYDSVSAHIPERFAWSGKSYNGTSLISPLYNNTNIVFYHNGYYRILVSPTLPQDLLDDFFVHVNVTHTLTSQSFAGLDTVHLNEHTYKFPLLFFSTPLNLTSYKVLSEPNSTKHCDILSGLICVPQNIQHNVIDDAVKIYRVSFAVSDKQDNSFLGMVEFLLNYHKANDIEEPFSMMLLSDMYEFNTPQIIDASTGVVLVNKTGIHYNLKPTNKYIDFELDTIQQGITDRSNYNAFNATIGEITDHTVWSDQDVFGVDPIHFALNGMTHDVKISAKRDGSEKTNTIQINPSGKTISYPINMYPENHLESTRSSLFLGLSPSTFFGDEYEVYVDGVYMPKQGQFNTHDNTVCSGDVCQVRINDDEPVDVRLENIWGGVAVQKQVEPFLIPEFAMDWNLAFTRIAYIAVGLVSIYLVYVFVKKFGKSFSSKQSKMQ